MSVVPSFFCYCGTGCEGLIASDAGKPSGVHVDQVYPVHRASVRGHVSREAA